MGLAFLLQEEEEEAKSTWLLGLNNSRNKDLYIKEFYEILKKEALRQEQLEEYQIALTIRQQIRLLLPKDFDNLVQISYLSLKL